MNDALATLTKTVDVQDSEQVRQAAVDVAQWSLDLRLPYRPQSEIDLARLDLWALQLTLDAETGDAGAVGGDVFTICYIRDRILDTLDDADVARFNTEVQKMQVAVDDEDIAVASEAAVHLQEILRQLRG